MYLKLTCLTLFVTLALHSLPYGLLKFPNAIYYIVYVHVFIDSLNNPK